ncbi:putative signal peptidase I [Aspergillus campestris IBT 28561]|uniref:Signal peptidase complex catalytic subunit SEC11 n=1 Tax=Aspergillus campestris (strain IBT 28561) TaxID=1392248 RepID=A0A2I1DH69_ASPC2|nr:putative signal peptidase I [Aspergillus campestris IBT 28561]PKY09209.1 putative signal peptidase I [Aspergillus campestris IBT 28561]
MLTRRIIGLCLRASLALAVPIMFWNALTIITGSTHPIIVVISESMSPTFNRGDILFLWNRQPWIQVGEIPVCWFKGLPLPMVHRAVRTVVLDTMRQGIMTKGDNNVVDDTLLYPAGKEFLGREEIIGVVKGSVPWLGWVAILLQDYPQIMQLGGGALLLGIALFA